MEPSAIPSLPQGLPLTFGSERSELEELASGNQVRTTLRWNRHSVPFKPHSVGSLVFAATPQRSGFKLLPGELHWGAAAEIASVNEATGTYQLRWVTRGLEGEPAGALSLHQWGHADLKPVPPSLTAEILQKEAVPHLGYEPPQYPIHRICAHRGDRDEFLVTYKGLPSSANAWVKRDQIPAEVDLSNPGIAECDTAEAAAAIQLAVFKAAPSRRIGKSKAAASRVGGKRRERSVEGRALVEGKRYKASEVQRPVGSVVNTRRQKH